jgi:aerobic carbon-monoxide dehydrogenase large subunit
MPVSKLVGARVKRREDPKLMRGLGQYVDDVRLPDTLHVEILRSPYAHAKIRSLELDAASQQPGVVAVVSGSEIKDQVGTLPVSGGNKTLRVPKHYVLAVDKVRHVGEGVVAVVAEDRYTARDALDLIRVEYEPLPVVTDPENGLITWPFA